MISKVITASLLVAASAHHTEFRKLDDDVVNSIQTCDNSNANFTSAFSGVDLSGLFDEGHNDDGGEGGHDHRALRQLHGYPVFEFLSCNTTHFVVSTDGAEATYPLNVYEYEECFQDDHGPPDNSTHGGDHGDDDDDEGDHEHEDGEDDHDHNPLRRMLHDDQVSNCYYALCVSQEHYDHLNSGGGHGGGDHGGDDHGDEDEHDHGDEDEHDHGDEDEHDHGDEDEHDHGDEDEHDHGDGNYRLLARTQDASQVLITAHVELCCASADYEARLQAHHACGVADFFQALQELDNDEEEPEIADEDDDDLTIPIAIGVVAAVGFALVGIAWFAKSTDAVDEEAMDIKEVAVDQKFTDVKTSSPEDVAVAEKAV